MNSTPNEHDWEGEEYDEEYHDEYDEKQYAQEEGNVTNFDPHYTEPLKEHSSESMNSMKRRKLSKVSAAYDTGGKGFLTPAEESLRRLDVKGEGTVSNAVAAQLMESKMHGDEIIRRLSRLLWLLFGMTLLLILANLGTAWAVAMMSKDTAIDSSSGEMWVKSGVDGQPQLVTTRQTGDTFVFFNFNISAKSVFIDDEIEKDSGSFFASPNTEDEEDTSEDEEIENDDTLFCITPENAAQIWQDASTGTSVTALLDFTSPVDYEQASTVEEVPIDLRSLSLRSDGAIMNETHVCLGSGQIDSGKPSFFCIDFVSPLCDPTSENNDQDSQGTDISSSISRSSTNADEDGTGSRRRLFNQALRSLQGGGSADDLIPQTPSTNNLRRRQQDLSQGGRRAATKCKTKRCQRKRKAARIAALAQQPNADNSVIVSVFTSTFTGKAETSTIGDGRRPINRLPTTFNKFHCQAFGKCGGPSHLARNPIQAAPASSFQNQAFGGSSPGNSNVGRTQSQTQPGSSGSTLQNQAFGGGSQANTNNGRTQSQTQPGSSSFQNQAFP